MVRPVQQVAARTDRGPAGQAPDVAAAEDNEPKGPKAPHPKDVDKPSKYSGNADQWMRWSRSFKKFLRRTESRWGAIHKKVESKRGDPVTSVDEEASVKDLELGTHLPAFKEQLSEILQCYTEGNAKALVLACDLPRGHHGQGWQPRGVPRGRPEDAPY